MNTRQLIVLLIITLMFFGCSQTPSEDDISELPTSDELATPISPTVVVEPGVTILADGVVQPVQPALSLAFSGGGTVRSIHVQVGDLVQTGDKVATLDDIDAKNEVAQAELSLQLAELALADLTKDVDPADLATMQANLASAQSNLASITKPPNEFQLQAAIQNLNSTKQALQDLLELPNLEQVEIAKANLDTVEIQVQAAQTSYDQVAYVDNVGMTPQAMNLQEATLNFERAQAEHRQALAGASEADIASAQSRVAQAQSELDTLQKAPDSEAVAAAIAQVDQAQASLDKLLAGASAKDIATAEINVSQAQLTLGRALRGLQDIALIAPTSGTVIAIDTTLGTRVSGGVPIVILLDAAQLEFHSTNLSERDLGQIALGQVGLVTLKTYPDRSIPATVTRIGLQTGVTVGDAATFPVIFALPTTDLDIRPGMTGRVEIRVEQ